jgi:AraC-like DNA-binding protein
VYVFIRNEYAVWFEISLVILSELFVFVLVYRVFTFQSLSKLIDSTTYSTESISDDQLEELGQRLEKAMMEQKPYLDKKLSLKQLSEEVNTSSNQLSLLFTEHYKTNFYAFVNKYRIKHLAFVLEEQNAMNYTVSALAEECGFNSKTTFYKVFKEEFGCTPSEYLNQQKNN